MPSLFGAAFDYSVRTIREDAARIRVLEAENKLLKAEIAALLLVKNPSLIEGVKE